MKNSYIHFLSVIRSNSLTSIGDVDSTAMLLLNEIAVQQYAGNSMTITEAMNLNHIASPATIHRKLDDLRNAGLIQSIFEGKNRRTKFLVPTKLANDYFDKMSNAMKKVVISTH